MTAESGNKKTDHAFCFFFLTGGEFADLVRGNLSFFPRTGNSGMSLVWSRSALAGLPRIPAQSWGAIQRFGGRERNYGVPSVQNQSLPMLLRLRFCRCRGSIPSPRLRERLLQSSVRDSCRVPEPSSVLLTGASLLGLLPLARRCREAQPRAGQLTGKFVLVNEDSFLSKTRTANRLTRRSLRRPS